MSILDLYHDFGIHYQTEDHKHCRPGWANLPCPFCSGNPGLHLGAHISSGRFYCWRCGGKKTTIALAELLGVSEDQAKQLVRKYQISRGKQAAPPQDQKIQFKPHRYPSDCHTQLPNPHRRYLANRKYDPDKLQEEWDLMATGPVSQLNGISYKHRLLIPIYWNEESVSFQARDITGKSNLKYIACPKEREKMHHKEILYGKNWDRDVGICVEGVTDVWRLGPLAFAIFGIEYTYKQIRVIAKTFRRVIILFDDDPQAIIQSKQLESELKFRGVKTYREFITGDPGSMAQDDADHLVKQLIK